MTQWQTAVWHSCSDFAALPFRMKQLTQLVKLTPGISGESLRLVFTNFYGTTDLTFNQVMVADNPQMAGSVKVTTRGQDQLTVPIKKMVHTDPIQFAVAAHRPLYVMITANRPQQYADFASTYDPSLVNAVYSQALHFRPPLPTGYHARKGWFCLAGMEVQSADSPLLVEMTGDSLAEMGLVTTPLINQLRRQTQRGVVVINTAVSGSRLLQPAPADEPLYATFGDSLLARQARESFPVDLVVALTGSNDLILPFWSRQAQLPTVQQLVDGFAQLNDLVGRRHGQLVTTTIPPFGLHLTSDQQAAGRHAAMIRRQVNAQLIKQVNTVDVEPLISDGEALKQTADFGDQVHYSVTGANLVATAISNWIDDKMSLR